MSEYEKLKVAFQKEVAILQKTCKHEFGWWIQDDDDINVLRRYCKICNFEEKDVVHEWRCIGRTPSGGLAGGDDVYRCGRCGLTTDEPSKYEIYASEPCKRRT
jgi:ribosomal protein S27AE